MKLWFGLIVASVGAWGGSSWAAEIPAAAPAPRASVVRVDRPGTTVQFVPQESAVQSMVENGLLRVTGRTNLVDAWRSLVSTQDVVGVKVFSRPGATSGTRPTVVEAVIRGLLAAGLPPQQIIIWDQHLSDLRLAGFVELAQRLGVRAAGSAEAGYDPETYYDTALLGQLVWGDLEFGKSGPGIGRKSFASKLVAGEIRKFISVAPLLNNNLTGVSGHCWGLAMASVDNTIRFENSGRRLAEAIPEILALEGLALRDRTVLAITDAILCQYQGEERQLLHYATVLDQLWFSTDPVALDLLGVLEIERQRTLAGLDAVKPALDLYENLAVMDLGAGHTNSIDVTRLTLGGEPASGR